MPWAHQGVAGMPRKLKKHGWGSRTEASPFPPCKIGFIFNYVYLCGYAHVSVGAHRCWKRVSDPLELDAGNLAQALKSSPYS